MLAGVCHTGYSQNIKSEPVTYYYSQLPSQPLDKSIRNFQSTIDAPFEEKNKNAVKNYQAEKAEAAARYQKAMAEYPALVKSAQDRFDKEMAEYNKKSFGKKLLEKQILEENNKPVKQIVPIPVAETIQPPVMQKSYDYKVLANTYLNLEGYQPVPANALKIAVTLYGYDYTQPRTVSEESNNLRFGSNTPTATVKSIAYHTEYSYRHPMSVKVLSPDGKELMNVTPSELNIYKTYKTAASQRTLQIDEEALIRTTEEKILQENLRFINQLVNDKYCFAKVKRTASLFYVKNNPDYTDLMTAFNEASSAMQMLQQDNKAATAKLAKACDLWNAALKESDVNNKKARIDKDVTLAICFNMLEAYFAQNKATEGQAIFDKLNTMNLSFTERKTKSDYEALFNDLKTRKQSNS